MTLRFQRVLPSILCAANLLAAMILSPCCSAAAQSGVLPGSPQEAQEKPQVPVFEFHSGFWVNLHHFLYQQVRARAAQTAKAPEGTPVSTEGLRADEKRDWKAALDYYASGMAGRDLLFNGDMVLINNRLAEMETCADLSGHARPACASGLQPEMIAALEAAAPVYRARWWAEHDRANRAWINAVGPLVREYGKKLAEQLAETFQASWPAGPLRVDVVVYAGSFGAYTTLDPSHLTISSTDPGNQGSVALEVVFHEAAHTLAASVRDAIARECRQRGKPIPRDLWHALLFYTTGEIVRRTLKPRAGNAPGEVYTPYAIRNRLYARGWTAYERALELYWQPYLDGRAEFSTAVARVVSAL